MNSILDAPLLAQQPDYPDRLGECFSSEGAAGLFVHFFAAQMGGISAETHSCLADFTSDHPHYVGVITSGHAAAAALGVDAMVEFADDALVLLGCLNDDELARYQELIGAAYLAS